jgi:hypothetical protein
VEQRRRPGKAQEAQRDNRRQLLLLGRWQLRRMLGRGLGVPQEQEDRAGPTTEREQTLARAQRRKKGRAGQREHEGSQVGLPLVEGALLEENLLATSTCSSTRLMT